MVQKGALVRVDYDAYTEEGELFDTTTKSVAEEAGKFEENVVYEPLPILIGAGRVIPGFDEALEGAEVGKQVDVTIPADKAFGPHDPSKTEVLSMREFQKQDVQPYPGMRFQNAGKTATVISVSAGRVRVDYNPTFAGKALRYKFTITEEVTDVEAKIKAFIEQAYGQGKADDFVITVDGTTATLQLPDSCKYDQRWFVAKYRLVSDLRAHAGIKTTRFVEEYLTEEPKAPEAPVAEAGPVADAPAADAEAPAADAEAPTND